MAVNKAANASTTNAMTAGATLRNRRSTVPVSVFMVRVVPPTKKVSDCRATVVARKERNQMENKHESQSGSAVRSTA